LPANSSIKNKLEPAIVEFSFATASDIDALLVIETQAFQFPWPRQHFASELSQPHSYTLLARRPETVDQEIVGYLIYWFIVDEMHILNLAVSPGSRRQGIARSLLGEAIRLAQAGNLKTAWLEVRPSNTAALGLYQALGFELVTTRKRYYSDSGEDALILFRPL
jgi:[ribosomal protein S18]-alanine N-acetyltransferase